LPIKKYLKENPGAPFIIAFIAMLITCSILVAYKRISSANKLAIYAFYSLVIGVALQLIASIRHKSRKVSNHELGVR